MKPRKRLSRNLTPLDVVLRFQQCSPDLIRVSESLPGGIVRHQELQKTDDIVAELEKRYIFFANEAVTARNLLNRGHACTFNVYLREP